MAAKSKAETPTREKAAPQSRRREIAGICLLALGLFGGLSMPKAVGTSLVVIALSSFAGFAGYASHVRVGYDVAVLIASAAILGSLVGAQVAPRVPAVVLRRAFAGLVAIVASVLVVGHAPT